MKQLLARWRDQPSATALERPRLADDVLVHQPQEPQLPWVAQRGSRDYLRIGKDLGRLMLAMDGIRDRATLAAELGPPWTTETVEHVVHQLSDKRLLADGRRRKRSTAHWVKFVPPLTVQLTLLRPAQLARLLGPIGGAMTSRWGAIGSTGFVLAGLLALVVQVPLLGDALGSPLPFGAYLALFAGFLLSMTLHEFAHGVALVHYGGRPSRMGVMLFYLMPAFFCDVSDAWRLPYGWQRVRVALAGAAVQALVGSAAALAALAVPGSGSSALRSALLVVAVGNLVAGLFNLLPFVKFDGYIALMSHVDIPHLRQRSIVDARRLLARWLFGGRYQRELPSLPWAPYLGLAGMVFPVVLVMIALSLWLDLLARTGIVGAAVLLAGAGYLGYLVCRGAVRLVKEAAGAGAHPIRTAGSLLGLAVAAAFALGVVTVPYTVSGGYVRADDGATFLVLPSTMEHVGVPAGAEVTLARGGMLLKQPSGAATVTSPDGAPASAPVSAFVPVTLPEIIQLPVHRYPVEVQREPADSVGVATVDLGRLPLGEWLYTTYVTPVYGW